MHRVVAVLIAFVLVGGACSDGGSDPDDGTHCANSSVLNDQLDDVTRLIAASLTEDVTAELEASFDLMVAAAAQLESEAPEDLAADARLLRQAYTDYRDVFAEANYVTRSVAIGDTRVTSLSTDNYAQASIRLYADCGLTAADPEQG